MIRDFRVLTVFALLLIRAVDARAGGAGMAVGPIAHSGYGVSPGWIVVVVLVLCAAVALAVRAYRQRK